MARSDFSSCYRLWYVEPVVQLRRYAPYLVAEVTVESDTLRGALTSGFKQVIPAIITQVICTRHIDAVYFKT